MDEIEEPGRDAVSMVRLEGYGLDDGGASERRTCTLELLAKSRENPQGRAAVLIRVRTGVRGHRCSSMW
jgi:hypothetical protein